jgi:predicted molibdopterin-dependent oxidoreductase YjgC
MTRYETPGGLTQTSTERRIMFSPEVEGPRIAEARPEWSVYVEIARRVKPELADRVTFASTQAIREEIARVVPAYAGIETLSKTGDQLQYGGPHLCAGWNFPTPDGKAHFMAVSLPDANIPEGLFAVATRRGKQFNTMVFEKKDALNGAVRDAVLMNAADARSLGLREGDPVVLSNEIGAYRGVVAFAPIKPRNLQVHWPEGNVLLDHRHRSPESHVPDYNAFVRIERASTAAD